METRLHDPVLTTEHNKTDKLLGEIRDMIHRAEDKAVERAKYADQAIRRHPYESLGIAFGVAMGLGLLVGFLVRRR